MIYSNNHTIVTLSEFLEAPEILVSSTLKRDGACLIILDDETLESIVWMDHKDILGDK